MSTPEKSDDQVKSRAAQIAAAAKKAVAKRATKVAPAARFQKLQPDELANVPPNKPTSSISASDASSTAKPTQNNRGDASVFLAKGEGGTKPTAVNPLAQIVVELSKHPRLIEAIGRLSSPPAIGVASSESMPTINSASSESMPTINSASVPTITMPRAWLGSVAPIVAAMHTATKRPIIVIIPQATELDNIAADLTSLTDRSIEIFPQASDDGQEESILQNEVLLRLQVLSNLQNARQSKKLTQPILVTTLPAIMHGVPTPDAMFSGRRVLKVGQRVDMAELRTWLKDSGYVSTTAVQLAGEFTVRGGILDVYPPDVADPLRLEWFDDEIESIRSFDPITQRSFDRLDVISLSSTKPVEQQTATLLDYCSDNTIVCFFEPVQVAYLGNAFLDRVPFPQRYRRVEEIIAQANSFANLHLVDLAEANKDLNLVESPLQNVDRASGDLEHLSARIDEALGPNRKAVVVCINDPEASRIHELLSSNNAYKQRRLLVQTGRMTHGFEINAGGSIVLTVSQLLKRTTLPRSVRKASSRAIDSFLDLRPGDYVVHLSHGIGIYQGLKLIEKVGQKQEHLEIEFAEGTKLFVPSTKIDLVQRYIGGTKSQPKLARIGSQSWVRQKEAAKEAVTDMAAELLELQAQRRSQPGIAFTQDTVWQSQFEGSFPYEETADQITAVAAMKSDMTQPRPMDRLICGDVGFGKTEVAMRAAFKAVDNGFQVAVLVPTTVLAEQHYKTFRERMADFPFDIARLSRFCTPQQDRDIVRRIGSGNVDIVIGTTRVVSNDIHWFNLGLVIVDEEQRFGVSAKEKLKQQRPNLDVLTLSATPIPRTLHMSLLGVRDISNLETAPQERLAVETKVTRFEDAIVRNAILRELNRGGQIFFVHNRVHDMADIAARLTRLVPEARIVVGHGQMPESDLERVMIDFIEHRYDILLSTTIIESGLDIPNANTIFVDQADHYGLAELHQLRGRVGRYKHQAYCYLLIDKHKHLNAEASRRMHAIEEYSHIGAGFGIAMRDLEIRGAGNLLGTQQSGHIAAVGYELYCQLLESAVRALKHQPPKLSIDVEVNLPIEAFISSTYVPEMRHKIDLYRRLSRIDDVQSIAGIRQEMVDRFGKIPIETERLLEIAQLRIDATIWSVRYIGVEEDHLTFTYADQHRIEQLARKHRGRLKLYGGQKAYWSLIDEPRSVLELTSMILQP
jgi:transcription-repair coupling factor (superfamily II helicase)